MKIHRSIRRSLFLGLIVLMSLSMVACVETLGWRLGAPTEKGWLLFPWVKDRLVAQNVCCWLLGRSYGRSKVYEALQAATRQLQKEYPGSVVAYMDVGGRRRGPLGGHLSHRSGKDVDILYFGHDARGAYYPQLPSLFLIGYCLDYGRDRRCGELIFDTPRAWVYLQCLRTNGVLGIERIFVEPYIKRWLIEEGEKEGASAEALDWARAKLCYAGYWAASHKNHFHIRFLFPGEETHITKPPKNWRPTRTPTPVSSSTPTPTPPSTAQP